MFYTPAPLIFTLLTFVFILLTLWRLHRVRNRKTRTGALLQLLVNVMASAVLFFLATWAFLSFYLKWVFLALVILLALRAVLHILTLPRGAGIKIRLGGFIRILGVLIYGIILGAAIHGSYYHGHETFSMQFPFKGGTYYIMQGGSNRFLNPFHGNFSWTRYGHALDIGEVNKFGMRSSNLIPGKLSDFEIYGDTIYCPCSGKLLLAVDGVEDNEPGWMNHNQVHGNHIVIQ
nr:hypothetical protein [Bacteroidota bacterium]